MSSFFSPNVTYGASTPLSYLQSASYLPVNKLLFHLFLVSLYLSIRVAPGTRLRRSVPLRLSASPGSRRLHHVLIVIFMLSSFLLYSLPCVVIFLVSVSYLFASLQNFQSLLQHIEYHRRSSSICLVFVPNCLLLNRSHGFRIAGLDELFRSYA